MAIRLANRRYASTRMTSIRKLEGGLTTLEMEYDDKRAEGTHLAKSELTSAFSTIKERVKQAIWTLFRTLDAARFVLVLSYS